MAQQRHTFKGKSAAVFVTQDGQVINANIENLTILVDDGTNDWDFSSYTDFYLPPVPRYTLEGDMVPITDTGIIFEVRRNR